MRTGITITLLATLGVASVVAAAAMETARAQSSAGDAARGKAVFERCAACHSLDEGGKEPSDGPSLKGLFGRKAGSRDDFRYSAAMARSGVVWSPETVDVFVADPQAFIRGNRMSFAGVPDKADRDDLVAYLLQATRPKE
jgi:cytochrome c